MGPNYLPRGGRTGVKKLVPVLVCVTPVCEGILVPSGRNINKKKVFPDTNYRSFPIDYLGNSFSRRARRLSHIN